jgi:hypothetical protein
MAQIARENELKESLGLMPTVEQPPEPASEPPIPEPEAKDPDDDEEDAEDEEAQPRPSVA